jgi:YD repeat-containing protein
VTSTTDGRSITLAYAYDALGRKTEAHDGTITGQLRACWSYDSVAKGQPTSSSRYDSGKTYTSTVGSYDDGYRALSTTYTMPGFGTGGTDLTYVAGSTYKVNGAPATQSLPGVGGLPAETLTYTYTPQGLASTIGSGSTTYVAGTSYAFDGLITQRTLGVAGK